MMLGLRNDGGMKRFETRTMVRGVPINYMCINYDMGNMIADFIHGRRSKVRLLYARIQLDNQSL